MERPFGSRTELVTSIVGGKDCVFTCYDNGCCLCALEKAYRKGKTTFCKPISCALYPIRAKKLRNGTIALNYHQWEVCADARAKGQELQLPVYRFLKEPLIRSFGEEWYHELEEVADEIHISQAQVSRLEKNALKSMYQYLKSE